MKPRLMLLLLISMLVPAFAFAQTADLLSQAKKEGEVILYTTMTVGDFQLFNKAAKEKYPFLNIRHVYLSSARQTARVMQEFRAGRVQADVLGNSPETLLYLKQQGVLGCLPLAGSNQPFERRLGSGGLLVRDYHRSSGHRL